MILVPGAFYNSFLFWSKPSALLRELGYKNIFLVKYSKRDRSYSEKFSNKTGDIDFSFDVVECRRQVLLARRQFGPNKKYVFVGHSKSGLVGQVLAEEDLFDGLIAINPAVPRGFSAVTLSSLWCMKGVLFQAIKRFSVKIPIKKSFRSFVWGHLPKGTPKQIARECFDNLVWESGLLIWDLAFNKPKVNPLRISIPIIFFASNQDRIVSASSVRKVARWHSENRKETSGKIIFSLLSGAHDPFVGEQKKQILGAIDAWIRQSF